MEQELTSADYVANTLNMYNHTANVTLPKFTPVTHGDVEKLIKGAATKSCVLDVLPTWLLKENMSVFIPVIANIINMSLSTGTFPTPLKQVVLNPLIKKQLNSERTQKLSPCCQHQVPLKIN